MNLMCLLLAQSTQAAPAPGGGMEMFVRQLLPLILILGVFWWIMSRGKNKERQRFQQMLDSMKKNDRIQTIGGLLGTVVDVRDNEVVVKVDETNNVKVRFLKSAIKEVIRDAENKGT